MAATIKQTPGAIGYIEYGFAKLGKLPMAWLENKAGAFLEPTLESGQAALAGVSCQQISGPGCLTPGRRRLSIVSYTWMLFYKKYDDPKMAAAIRSTVLYC